MAITNQERVGKAMELLRDGLRPFVEREMNAQFGERWSRVVDEVLTDSRLGKGKGEATNDQHLINLPTQSVVMTFAQVEAVLGFDLRQSARQYQEWWSNEAPERTRHRQSRTWTMAGRMATPNLKAETVRFDKSSH